MLQDLALYAELLIFLVGTFMYGFLARELLQQRAILPGNRPMRLLALSLTLWYAGALLDELATILLPDSAVWIAVGPAVDVARALGFLASFPLLVHAIWRMIEPRPHGIVVAWCYLTLALFVTPALAILRDRQMLLADVGREAFTRFVVHVTVTTVTALALILVARTRVSRPDLVRFLRWLVTTIAVVEGLVLLGYIVIDVWSEPLWRMLVSTSGLVLGMTFLYFVRAYNLLSLSLSNRSLRHFASILALLLLILLAGPALGAAGDPVFHRVLAWGLLLAVLAGVLFGPATRWAARRSPRLARLFGRSISPDEVTELTEKLQDLDLSPDDAKALVASEVSRWVGAPARFVSAPEPGAAFLWSYFDDGDTRAFNRLRAPSTTAANALVAGELHAAFPIRAEERLEAVFVIGTSATGGGYEDGEMESIQLVLDQLAAAVEIRRLMQARLDAERRQIEHERLSMLGMVSASLAHELKNPLSSMKALAQTLHEELARDDPESDAAKDLAVIVEQVDRLNGVAREVLGFSKPAGNGESTELSAIVASAAYVLDHEARRRGIVIDRDGVDAGNEAPGTPATWQTIVFNLLLNAVRHAPDGSTVRLRLETSAAGITFACENEGPPIADDVLARLFEPFVTGADGTGLGLSLVKRRVEEMGGTIELDNAPGRIVFRVRVQPE